ncbi:prolyl oligopeptidase family serine peptidase [Primorskyibacter aestuariivivens]|uniref:alpha/beta hydrolase family protein n=1 Tax=Primorskyibacter aestuariivivens TaxID=1888912 RepID=UPI002300675E|nr:dienelactone hydrolase family protein [Primorskyibacter aestuariivivens]MDA7428873.1 prolyl oligopeptidase family serine peptidase [Primorskyibacter aestuariivivens]
MASARRVVQAGIAAMAIGLTGWGGFELFRPAYEGGAGIAYGAAHAPLRGTDVEFHIWYPAEPGGKRVRVGGNGVFHGTPAGRRAPHRAGRFPAIVISHGAGGNAGQFGWIAEKLAEAGFVVLLPNHPGTTTGNASAQAAVRVWERPGDVTAVLDEVTGHPDRYPFVDPDRMAALGFSAGGYTAMALSGARGDPDRLQRFCDAGDHGMSDCAFLAQFGIDLHKMDLSPAGQDLRDPRFSTAVIVDPGIVSTLTQDSLSEIAVPMMVANLGDENLVPQGVYTRQAAEQIPGADYVVIPDATHFSFLAECTPKGAAILKDEGEPDPLCDDAGGRSRAAILAELAQRILAFFNDHL